MTGPDAPGTPSELPLVTVIPDINTIQMSGLTEEPTTRDHVWDRAHAAEQAGEDLAKLYMALGEGVFTLDEVAAGADLSERKAMNAGLRLGSALAEELFSYDVTGDGTFFSFGAFSIASRRATEQEKEELADARRLARDEALRAKKEEVLAAEAEKTHLIQADHALVTVGTRDYYIPIISTSAVLAIRTLQAIVELYNTSKWNQVQFSILNRMVWDSMPLEERELFTDKEKQIYGNGNVVDKEVKQFVSQVANPLGMARRGSIERIFILMEPSGVAIDVRDEPPEEPYDPATVTPIFPPGTEKLTVQSNNLGAVDAAEFSGIAEVLDRVIEAERLTHEDAIDVLDVIMDRRSRVLARRILERRYGTDSAVAMLDHLDRRAQGALGRSRYYMAKRDRTIRGYRGARSTQQISGRLSDRTFKHLTSGDSSRSLTTRWNFGKWQP